MNLLSNALKYSTPETPVIINARQQGEEVLVSIEDFGVGITRGGSPESI